MKITNKRKQASKRKNLSNYKLQILTILSLRKQTQIKSGINKWKDAHNPKRPKLITSSPTLPTSIHIKKVVYILRNSVVSE